MCDFFKFQIKIGSLTSHRRRRKKNILRVNQIEKMGGKARQRKERENENKKKRNYHTNGRRKKVV